jgi:glycosyltransferase involved in cell wall biosynthesis
MLAQAMSSGVAVIGSTCGETPNVMGDAGLTFPEGDVDALTAALRQVQHSPALRKELGQRGLPGYASVTPSRASLNTQSRCGGMRSIADRGMSCRL